MTSFDRCIVLIMVLVLGYCVGRVHGYMLEPNVDPLLNGLQEVAQKTDNISEVHQIAIDSIHRYERQ